MNQLNKDVIDTNKISWKQATSKKDTKILVVQVFSSGDGENGKGTRILINDDEVKMEPNELGNDEGLHIVAINPEHGYISVSQIFDLHYNPKSMMGPSGTLPV